MTQETDTSELKVHVLYIREKIDALEARLSKYDSLKSNISILDNKLKTQSKLIYLLYTLLVTVCGVIIYKG